MFEYEAFKTIMEECESLCDISVRLAEALGERVEDSVIDRSVVRILSAIADDMDDIGDDETKGLPYIIFYAFECNFGKEPKLGLDSLDKLWAKII